MNNEIELDIFKKHFEKQWIKELSKDYSKMMKSIDSFGYCKNKSFFMTGKNKGLGHMYGLNDKNIKKEISDYFERLLFLPNIAVLDHIIKNIETYQDLVFIDNGSGFGLLSIFLKKIGINCYNYDNFKQMVEKDVMKADLIKSFYDKYKISQPESKLEKIENCDAMISCGIWADNRHYNQYNLKYMLLDSRYFDKEGINMYKNIDLKKYNVAKDYKNIIKVFEREK